MFFGLPVPSDRLHTPAQKDRANPFMNDQPIIVSVQCGVMEALVQLASDENDNPSYRLLIARGDEQSLKLPIGEVPDLIQALANALRLVRHNHDQYAAARIVLEKLFESLDGPPSWLTHGLTSRTNS